MRKAILKKMFLLLIALFAACILGGCGYLPDNDPNYRDSVYHDFTIGKTYEPYSWKRDNTSTFLGTLGD